MQGRAPKLIKNAWEKVERNPGRSVGKLASVAGVSYGAMQNVLRADLGLYPCGKTEAQLVSRAARAKGLQRAGRLLEGLGDGMQPRVLWFDERLFTVRAVYNHQSGRVYAVNEQRVLLNGKLTFGERGRLLSFSGRGWLWLGTRYSFSSLGRGWG